MSLTSSCTAVYDAHPVLISDADRSASPTPTGVLRVIPIFDRIYDALERCTLLLKDYSVDYGILNYTR
jgi:hypothetical protein